MHFDTAEEIVAEFLDKLQKYAAQAEQTYRSAETPEEKLRHIDYIETSYASLSNFLRNELGYDIRLDDGTPFSQFYFNRIFYFRQMASIEAEKAREAVK